MLFFFGSFPLLWLFTSVEQFDWESIQVLCQSEQTAKQSHTTSLIALSVSVISSLLGYLFYRLSIHCRSIHFWVILYTLCFTITPYHVAQGWIQIIPASFTLYSSTGLVFLEVLQFCPLAFLIFHFTIPLNSQALSDTEKLLQIPFWKRELLIRRCDTLAPIGLNITLIFWLAFWNYETPSILRQQTYALNLYAAFGSFYDYEQALAYILRTVRYALPCLIGVVLFVRLNARFQRTLPERKPSNSIHRGLWLSLLPYCALLLPIIGLLRDISSFTILWNYWKDYQADILNTIWVGSSSALLTTFFSIGVYQLAKKYDSTAWLILAALLLLFIPSLGLGIGFVHWFTQSFKGEAGLERLILIKAILILPIAILCSAILSPKASKEVGDSFQLYNITWRAKIKLLVRTKYGPYFLSIWTICFLFSIKEVSASILNYPPDGATIALSIETMLHFEQPELISSLCLAQLCISLLAILVAIGLNYFLRK